MTLQKNIFLEKEADKYFERNKNAEISVQLKKSLSLMAQNLKPNAKVLEIGCSDGRNLNFLKEQFGFVCYGLDPSQNAINEGSKLYKDLNLSVGTAEHLPYENEEFDLIFFGFCLYLVDRQHLSKTVAEADRILKNQGFLSIIDFDVAFPKKRIYKHTSGVFSYKMDYSKLFLAYPHFVHVDKFAHSHVGDKFHTDPHERLATTILFKDFDNAYILEKD